MKILFQNEINTFVFEEGRCVSLQRSYLTKTIHAIEFQREYTMCAYRRNPRCVPSNQTGNQTLDITR